MAAEIVCSSIVSSDIAVDPGDTLQILSGGIPIDTFVSSSGLDVVLGEASNTVLSVSG